MQFSPVLEFVCSMLVFILFSVNTFTPTQNCAIIFVIAQVEKILIGQKYKSYKTSARCNSSLIILT